MSDFLHSNDHKNIRISYSKICNEIKSNDKQLTQNKTENLYQEFNIKDFIILRLIYSASKCSMFLVFHIESFHIFLMKTASNPEEKEINFCKNYSHRCFTKFYGFLTDDKKINGFVYEFMSNGSLSDFVQSSNKDKVDDIYSLIAIIRIFEGIEYLQSNSLIHRDLKPQNILIDHDYIPYISDFETIRYLNIDETETIITNDIGTYLYSSPEQYQGENISFPTDIYSFGLIIYFIIMKKHLKNEKSSFMANFSQTFQNFVDLCTNESPNDRPLIKEIKNYIIEEVNFFHDYEKYLFKDTIDIDGSIIIQFIYENIIIQNEFQEELNKFLNIVFFFEFIFLRQIGIISESKNKAEFLNKIGNIYYDGYGVEQDYLEAKKYFELAAQFNDPESFNALGVLYFRGDIDGKDYEKAKEYFELSAKQKNSMALYNLGILYLNGDGVKQDNDKAIEYFNSSMQQDNPCAILMLGNLYHDEQNYSKAKEYYKLLAKQNNSEALFHLGFYYEKGMGVKQNDLKAKKNYELSAQQNNLRAILYLECIYNKEESCQKILDLVKQFIKDDDSNILVYLGNLYFFGKEIEQDYLKSKKYYELAARDNNSDALCNLGILYDYGLGVKQNYLKAKKYYELSAKQNNSNSLYNLGVLYMNGSGVKQNYSKAKEYFELSAKQNNSDAILMLGKLACQSLLDLGVEADILKFMEFIEFFESTIKFKDNFIHFLLGLFYFFKNDFQKAIKYLKIHVEHNNSNAIAYFVLGIIYENGSGVEQNYEMAKKYYELSANLNFPDAMNSLGIFYKFGKGVKIDIIKANEYFNSALNQDKQFQAIDFVLSIKNEFKKTNFLDLFQHFFKLSNLDFGIYNTEFFEIITEIFQIENIMSLFGNHKADEFKNQDFLLNMGCDYLFEHSGEQNYLKAKKCFEILAQQNNPEALYYLGYIYKNGYGVKVDYSEAKKYFELSAKQNDSDALIELGYMYKNGYGVEQSYSKAKEYFELSVKQKNSDALIDIGNMYENGYGVKIDYPTAIYYYELSAKQNNRRAQYILGKIYEDGKLVKQNYSKAKEYFESSAEQGNPDALLSLGIFYNNGYDAEPNYKKAKEYFELSAQHNNSDALYNLGVLYENGNGVEKNYSTAMQYYELSAQLNNRFALNSLGYIYFTGNYVKKDYIKAKKYLELSSQIGNSVANIFLGDIYLDGFGVDKDVQIALNYYESNANMGDPYALEILGDIYYLGKEVKQDFSKAFEYYEKSSRFNNPASYYKLGKIYRKGKGVEQNYLTAKKYFEYASQLDNTRALFTLGYFYFTGYIFNIDILKSISYLEKCSEIKEEKFEVFISLANTTYYVNIENKYYYRSNNDLGLIYLIYFNDIEKAYQYINIAGLNEYPYGQNNLGLLYQFYLDKIENAEHFYERASKHNFSLAEYNLGYIKEKNNELEQAIELYIKASEHENEPLIFHNHKHIDARLEASKMFVICFTNLKLVDYYLSKNNLNEAKKYFIKSFDKLELKEENYSYKFRFIFNKENIKKSFEYLKLFILNFPLFNLSNQNLNINLKYFQQNEINDTKNNNNKAKKQINNKINELLNITELDKTKIKDDKDEDNKVNNLKNISFKNIIKSKALINQKTNVNQFNQIIFLEPNNVFDNPSKLFDFVILNNEFTKNLIDEIKEIIQIIETILYTPPYSILFGRLNIEQKKHIEDDKNDPNRKNVDNDFYDGFGIGEM